jgi:hypothetical protein
MDSEYPLCFRTVLNSVGVIQCSVSAGTTKDDQDPRDHHSVAPQIVIVFNLERETAIGSRQDVLRGALKLRLERRQAIGTSVRGEADVYTLAVGLWKAGAEASSRCHGRNKRPAELLLSLGLFQPSCERRGQGISVFRRPGLSIRRKETCRLPWVMPSTIIEPCSPGIGVPGSFLHTFELYPVLQSRGYGSSAHGSASPQHWLTDCP